MSRRRKPKYVPRLVKNTNTTPKIAMVVIRKLVVSGDMFAVSYPNY
jgi:hypothetical protein